MQLYRDNEVVFSLSRINDIKKPTLNFLVSVFLCIVVL